MVWCHLIIYRQTYNLELKMITSFLLTHDCNRELTNRQDPLSDCHLYMIDDLTSFKLLKQAINYVIGAM